MNDEQTFWYDKNEIVSLPFEILFGLHADKVKRMLEEANLSDVVFRCGVYKYKESEQ
jgi:hypothetical protein